MSYESRELPKGPVRVLSLDGGGIYGYTAALWLKELCKRDSEFLTPGNVWLFAGCSSGALNSLLLARHEDPREALLDGVLDRFWADCEGIFTVQPAVFRSMFSEKAFLELLERHLGEETVLGELPQNVLISTFDWHGRQTYPDFEVGNRVDPSVPYWERAPDRGDHDESDRALLDEKVFRKRVGVTRHWQPRFFSNVLYEQDDRYRAAEIGYGAATPPGLRAIRGGIADGASFSANPSARAVSTIARLQRLAHWRARSRGQPDAKVGGALGRTRVLSLGAGTDLPYLDVKDLDAGGTLWSMRPANWQKDNVYSPAYYSLQPAGEEAVQICFDLLGNRYQRLNPDIIDLPGLLDMPTVVAAIAAGNPTGRTWQLKKIEEGVAGDRSQEALDHTHAKYLSTKVWKGT